MLTKNLKKYQKWEQNGWWPKSKVFVPLKEIKKEVRVSGGGWPTSFLLPAIKTISSYEEKTFDDALLWKFKLLHFEILSYTHIKL